MPWGGTRSPEQASPPLAEVCRAERALHRTGASSKLVCVDTFSTYAALEAGGSLGPRCALRRRAVHPIAVGECRRASCCRSVFRHRRVDLRAHAGVGGIQNCRGRRLPRVSRCLAASPPLVLRAHSASRQATRLSPATPDFSLRWLDSAGAVGTTAAAGASKRAPATPRAGPPAIVIPAAPGDLHTAADFFTTASCAAPSRRNSATAAPLHERRPPVTSSCCPSYLHSLPFGLGCLAGCSYKSLFSANEPSEFWLSGYTAIGASETGQTWPLRPISGCRSTRSISRTSAPAGRRLDSTSSSWPLRSRYDSQGPTSPSRFLFRLNPGKPSDKVNQIAITTTAGGTVNLAASRWSTRAVRSSRITAVVFKNPAARSTIVDKFD